MRERVRAVLGVWMPMVLGLILITVAANFLLIGPRSGPPDPNFPLDPTAAGACGGGLIIVGVLLLLSTYGRRRKARASQGRGR